MTPQIIKDMDEDTYHASSGVGEGQFITRSMLSCYDKDGPRGFYLRYVEKHGLAQFGGNKATDFGSLVDVLLTRGDQGIAYTDMGPENPKTKKPYGKTTAAFAEWSKNLEAQGSMVVDRSDMERAQLMIDEAKRHPPLEYALCDKDAMHQVCVRWEDEITGLPLQVMIDVVVPGGLVDVKTGRLNPAKFITSANSYGYDIQAALYADAWKIATGKELPFVFAYMQSSFPFAAAPIQLPQQLIDSARDRYRKALDGIASNDLQSDLHKTPLVPEIPAWWWFEHEQEESE